MSTQENIKVIERYSQEVMNEGNLDAVDELLADDYVHHTPPPGMAPTREGFKQFVIQAHNGLGDLTLTTDDILAQGDKVVQRWTNKGVHYLPGCGRQSDRRVGAAGYHEHDAADGRRARTCFVNILTNW